MAGALSRIIQRARPSRRRRSLTQPRASIRRPSRACSGADRSPCVRGTCSTTGPSSSSQMPPRLRSTWRTCPRSTAKPPRDSAPRLDHRRSPPEALAGGSGALLGCPMAIDQPGIRRDCDKIAQPFGQQDGFEIVAAGVIGMGERAAVAILGLAPGNQADTTAVGLHQRIETPPSGFGEGLGGLALAPELGRVHADQPDAAPVGQPQRIAVDHRRDRQLARRLDDRAEGEGLGAAQQRNKKGAHQGRLLQVAGQPLGLPAGWPLTACHRIRRSAA